MTSTDTTTTTTYRVTVYGGENGEQRFTDVNEMRDALVALQNAGIRFRPNFEAVVALIDNGAYGLSWEQLRERVYNLLDEGYYGELEEVGSSDMNHMIVGQVQMDRIAPRPALPMHPAMELFARSYAQACEFHQDSTHMTTHATFQAVDDVMRTYGIRFDREAQYAILTAPSILAEGRMADALRLISKAWAAVEASR